MRALVVVVALALVAASYANVLSKLAAVHKGEPEWPQFVTFALQYSRAYPTTGEAELRYINFKNTLARNVVLREQNPLATFGVNKFADLSQEEFTAMYLNSQKISRTPHNLPMAKAKDIGALPTSWDWATQGAVTPVKDQGQCGSCWSFSTTGNVEGQWFLKTKKLVGLSEQNLVDCDHECSQYQNQQSCDAGCEGGLMWNAFEYIITNGGIDTEDSYPYTAADGSCSFSNTSVGAKITNWTMISTDEGDMANWLYQNGPISIAVAADEWQFYIGGVFYIPCDQELDHGVLITGFDVETDIFFQQMPYWIIKNSWGADWGENGYIWIERGNDECGISTVPCSSIV